MRVHPTMNELNTTARPCSRGSAIITLPPKVGALEQIDVDRNGSLIDHICAVFTLLRENVPITFLGGYRISCIAYRLLSSIG